MTWERMSIDELAAFEKAVGGKLLKYNGIWWRETKPFFFRPLNVMEMFPANMNYYPKKFIFGGVQHLVPQNSLTNSTINYFIFKDLKQYSIENFKNKKRWEIRKGFKNFIVKPINNLDEFISEGYDVYMSFYKRTKYNYKKGRTRQSHFENWARTLFNFPKILLLGAYQEGKLSAVSISYLIDNTINYATFFSKTEALSLNVSDAMLHFIRDRAKNFERAKYIFWGRETGNKNIDLHKIYQGCELIPYPAYLKLNNLIYLYLKYFRKDIYRRFV
jgi:hypothetical protein